MCSLKVDKKIFSDSFKEGKSDAQGPATGSADPRRLSPVHIIVSKDGRRTVLKDIKVRYLISHIIYFVDAQTFDVSMN